MLRKILMTEHLSKYKWKGIEWAKPRVEINWKK